MDGAEAASAGQIYAAHADQAFCSKLQRCGSEVDMLMEPDLEQQVQGVGQEPVAVFAEP